MSLTIYNTPKEFAPAYNQMIYTLSSTLSGNDNFRYVADIYVNGAATYTRLSVAPNPTNNYGVFDISGILSNYLSSDITDSSGTFMKCPNSILSYEVQFGYEFGTTTINTYANITNNFGVAFNGAFDMLTNYVKNEHVLFNTSTKFLTDCPNIITRVGEKLNIGWMVGAVSQKYLQIKVYTSTGTLQKTVRLQSPYDAAITSEKSLNANVSYDYLNTLVTGDLQFGTAPIFNASSSYYTIQMMFSDDGTAFTPVSEEKRITIEELCTKYSPIRFKFLNNYGKYDYYTFSGAKTKNTEIKRTTYKSQPNQWSGTNYTYSNSSRGMVQYETTLNDTITINSDWISESESEWLEQLVTSPDVYIYENSELVSINITNSNYQTKYVASEQLFNLSVSFNYSFNRIRQRRWLKLKYT